MTQIPLSLDSREVLRGAKRITADVAKTLGPMGKTLEIPGIGPSRESGVVASREYRFGKLGERIGAARLYELSRAVSGPDGDGDGVGRSLIIGTRILQLGFVRVSSVSDLEP